MRESEPRAIGNLANEHQAWERYCRAEVVRADAELARDGLLRCADDRQREAESLLPVALPGPEILIRIFLQVIFVGALGEPRTHHLIC